MQSSFGYRASSTKKGCIKRDSRSGGCCKTAKDRVRSTARGETNLESEEEMYEACFAESNLDDHWYNEEEGEEEEEEAIFNDDRYPTDIEINTVLFEEISSKTCYRKEIV